jgi:hypothetical protein
VWYLPPPPASPGLLPAAAAARPPPCPFLTRVSPYCRACFVLHRIVPQGRHPEADGGGGPLHSRPRARPGQALLHARGGCLLHPGGCWLLLLLHCRQWGGLVYVALLLLVGAMGASIISCPVLPARRPGSPDPSIPSPPLPCRPAGPRNSGDRARGAGHCADRR